MTALPDDAAQATLVGRVHDPGTGPCVVVVRGDEVADITAAAPTLSQLLAQDDPVSAVRAATATRAWPLASVLEGEPALLAPADLQVIKACGVTFVRSMVERVIEERAGGDASRAGAVRKELEDVVGGNIAAVTPGSDEAAELKAKLQEDGQWSQYLEVGLGPDAEVFTKAPVLSAVGSGATVGVSRASRWNNPEPEVVLAVDPRGQPVGAMLGNDVNLRDLEGRSALLLGKAKDNNASCALGPFLRLFDDGFTLDDVRGLELRLEVTGTDGFVLDGRSSMREIARDPLELVAATYGDHHQYPDGFVLMTGTLFAPTEDRDEPGGGFTHKTGDVVRISTPRLGTLENTVAPAEEAPRWEFGIAALFENLAARGLLGRA